MSLTSQNLVERALRRAGVQGTAPTSRLLVLIPDALKALAVRLAEEGSDLLKVDFSLTVASGVSSLATHLSASEPILLDYLIKSKITSSDSTQPWQPLPDYATLSLERPAFGMIYFTVEGTSLIATDTTGALDSLSTTATARTHCVPALSTISGNSDLEEMLVGELGELFTGEEEKA